FPFLTHLQLADNQLQGPVPAEICDLVDTVQLATFSYNQLSASSEQVAQCLRRLQLNWRATQTVAPEALRVTTITTNSFTLRWDPIAYQGDGGYYEISYASPLTTGEVSTYTVHGITADKSAAAYQLDGLAAGQSYRIRVRSYTPAHVAQENEQYSPYTYAAGTTRTTGDPVLVLIYFPADNDLSPYIPSVVRRVQLGTRANPNVQVAMFVDARGDHNTEVFAVANGEIQRTNLVQERWGTDELDSTDPAVLTWFLQTARNRFPAARTVVSLMGHGSGMTPEVEGETFLDEIGGENTSAGIPALPKTIPATPGDYENRGGYLSTADFAQALAAATDNGANPFDVVFFDQCFQGNLDVLYEMHTYARVFVASPNYAWLAAPYHRYLIDFVPTATPEVLGETIITHYQAALTNAQPNVIFWVRGMDLPPVANALSALADALQSAVASGADELVGDAALRSQYVDTTQCGRGNLHLGQPDELVGAGSLARNLTRAFEPGDVDGVNAAANELLTTLAAVHSLARTGRPSIAPDQFWNYEDTLTVVAPLLKRAMTHREMVQANVWRASVYRETAPMSAILAGNPSQTATVTSAFVLAQDGRWDDFLRGWYTNPLTPTVGVRCHYMPPAIVRGTITETLALTIAEGSDPPSGEILTIDWTATTVTDATDYWLYVRPADSIQWQVLATLPLT
ncbi:MAG: fibronectin type III domain-containing protein, partial [Caldilineaceae bacterium]|nr:fibronectin type III domain-containing protein [Caldilineaceae bacterium]